MRRRHLIGAIGLPIAGAVVLVITLWPTQVDSAYGPELAWLIDLLRDRGLSWHEAYGLLEFTANIVMFVPLGFFAGLLLAGRRILRGARGVFGAFGLPLAIVLVSAAIEGAQLLFLPERVPSLLDVLANSLGGWIGLGLAALIPSPAAASAPSEASDISTSR